ncbi:MAG: HAMP domain-containing histidine kinase [Polyangiaceae bacterium]|nr:HAMP domain-containing histidine kinase [Polyangiaceae bacterium]
MSGEAWSARSNERKSLPPTFEAPRLEELLPADALRELVASFEKTCGLGVWVRSTSGAELAGSSAQDAFASVSLEGDEISEVRAPEGLTYVLGLVEFDHDPIGRIAVGPYVVSDREDCEARPPRMRPATARAHLDHLRISLDLILHARQRASYAAQMHLATIEESYAELLRKNSALEEAFSRLQELDHLKSSFLATISHELRTPLTSIIGYSEMLAEGMCGPLTKEQLEFVQTIRMKGDQLLRLILSLLDLSKLESGTLRMHPISMPIEAVLQDAISTMAPAAAKKGVKVALATQPATPALRADPDRLRQVFVNLLENAVKFTPKGGSPSRRRARRRRGGPTRRDRGRALDRAHADQDASRDVRGLGPRLRCRARGRLRGHGAGRPAAPKRAAGACAAPHPHRLVGRLERRGDALSTRSDAARRRGLSRHDGGALGSGGHGRPADGDRLRADPPHEHAR